MEKLFYYSGLILWICIIGIITLYILGVIYQKFLRKSLLFHWFGVMGGWLTYKKQVAIPIDQNVKDAIEFRYKALKEANIRGFEQRFLRKYLDNVKIKERGENWTVFDN